MKNLKLSLAIIILLLTLTNEKSFAQAIFEWAKSYSSSELNAQIAYDAVTDTNGNVYVTGSTARGDDAIDIVTVKYNSAGVYIWGKSFDFPGYDYSNEVGRSIASYRNGSSTFIYCAGVMTFGTNNNIIVIKYDNNGVQKWVKNFTYAGVGYVNTIPKVMSDASGNCYVSGGSEESPYVVKYDSSGTVLFGTVVPKPAGYTRSGSYDMAFDASGNIFITGNCDSSSTVNYYTSKLNSSGVIQWSKIFRGLINYQSKARKIAVGISGNVYVTGEYQSGSMDYLTIKYNPATGDTIWTKKYNGTANGTDMAKVLSLDASENVYVSGVTNFTGNGDMATVKYNSSGVQQWAKIYAGAGGYLDEPKDMVIDNNGNIFIAGTSDYSYFGNYITLKYNQNGDTAWTKKYDFAVPDFETPYAITLDNSGNVILTGSSGYENDCDFGTIKYNSSGTLQWARKFYDAQLVNDAANGIVADKNGNVYTVGTTRTNSGDNISVIKYNSAGVQKWIYNRGGGGVTGYDVRDQGNAIAIDTSGNVYFTGTWYYWANTKNDICTGKLDSNGVAQWFTVNNGAGTEYGDDQGNDITVDVAGNVYVAGQIAGPGGDLNYIIIKYNSTGVAQWTRGYGAIVGGKDFANAIAVDQSGNVFVTGTSDGTGTGTNITTIKYSSIGVQQWIKTWSSAGDDFAKDIGIDKAGNVYVCGGEGEPQGRSLLVKYLSASGIQHWERLEQGGSNTNNGYFNSLTFDTSKTKIFLTGPDGGANGADNDIAYAMYDTSFSNTFYYQRKWNPGYSVDGMSIAVDDNSIFIAGNRYSASSGNDIFIFRALQNGADLWQTNFNGNSSGADGITSGNGIVLSNGNIYVAGNSYDSIKGSTIATIKYKNPNYYLLSYQALEGAYTGYPYTYTDTIKVKLRNAVSPYNIVDSTQGVNVSPPSISLYLQSFFSNVTNGVNYYIVMHHRNTLETWSSTPRSFTNGYLLYSFADSIHKAYGNNMKLIDPNYSLYGFYSGDVNQDGIIDVSDVVNIYNDMNNFTSGYVSTDLTGDDFVDVSDLIIAFNNANNVVSVMSP